MKRFDEQVCFKLASMHRAVLEDAAATRGRSLSNYCREILRREADQLIAADPQIAERCGRRSEAA